MMLHRTQRDKGLGKEGRDGDPAPPNVNIPRQPDKRRRRQVEIEVSTAGVTV